MQKILVSILIVFFMFSFVPHDSFAHQSGCHRWHSCPSDTGSYVCGDTGYCSQCPDNQYCKAGQPKKYPEESQSNYDDYKPKENPVPKVEKEKTEPKPVKPKEIPKPVPNCDGKGMCVVGIVQRIIDGDTLIIDKYTVRLSLANAPEKNQAGFKEAAAFTSKLCKIGSYAVFDQDIRQKMDKYGRVIGKVTCDGKVLNSELVLSGHATILKQYCVKSEYSKETWAKTHGC